jgi:hypothetical protein
MKLPGFALSSLRATSWPFAILDSSSAISESMRRRTSVRGQEVDGGIRAIEYDVTYAVRSDFETKSPIILG